MKKVVAILLMIAVSLPVINLMGGGQYHDHPIGLAGDHSHQLVLSEGSLYLNLIYPGHLEDASAVTFKRVQYFDASKQMTLKGGKNLGVPSPSYLGVSPLNLLEAVVLTSSAPVLLFVGDPRGKPS